jgi:hypothetical protein
MESEDMTGKPSKTREELSAIVMEVLKKRPDCGKVTGVVIAPIPRALSRAANWHAAFTTQGRAAVPHIAWQVGSQVADEFDLEPPP